MYQVVNQTTWHIVESFFVKTLAWVHRILKNVLIYVDVGWFLTSGLGLLTGPFEFCAVQLQRLLLLSMNHYVFPLG